MKKIICGVLVVAILCCGLSFALTLTDISNHWAKTYIESLVSEGIINGYEDGTFKPEGQIKKGEFIKLIMAASLPDEQFNSIGKYVHWSSPYLECAEDYNIIAKGSINDSNANDVISRAEVVEILGKCDILLKGTTQDVSPLSFTDIVSISDFQYVMLSHCVSYGYITGYDDGSFKPDKTLTRAEVATILYRYYNHSNEVDL